jgi:effector-binding domain-containing protein
MTDPRAPSSNIELRVLQPHQVASVRQEVSQALVTQSLGQCFRQVREALAEQGVATDGSPFARWHTWGEHVDMEVGLIVPQAITAAGEVKPSELPGGPAAIAVHAGPYEGLRATYDAISAWLTRAGREASGGAWEIYLTDPSAEPDPTRWLTEVIFPLRPEQGTAADEPTS